MKDEQLFAEAIAISDASKRAAFIDRACGDDHRLREEVDALLQAHESAGSFLQHPTAQGQAGEDTDRTQLLRVRCPHCQDVVEVPECSELNDLDCCGCGSNFSLVSDQAAAIDTVKDSKLGHFQLIERVGMGSFGSVWRARDTQLDRTVAVKIPRHEQFDIDQEKAFLREAQSAAQLNHPGIVPVHEVGREGDTLYIVSEFVQGMTLADWLTDQQPSTAEAAEIAAKVAAALHHAHERGVVHRDLKPGNIMLDNEQEPRLMDFGLARREANDIRMSVTGQIFGTPAYMSPEQARGEGSRADRRSDVYSLGVLLFQLLTGELPFRGAIRMLLHQVINEEAPSPRKLNGNVSRDLETITLKCLEKSPDRRYSTAQEVRDELERVRRGEPILARPISAIERGTRWVSRHRAVSALIAIVSLTLTLGIVVSNYYAIAAFNSKQQSEASAAAARESEALALEREADALRQLGLAQIANANAAYLNQDGQRAKKYLKLCPEQHRDTNWRYLNEYCDKVLYRRDLPGIYGMHPDPANPGYFFVYQASGRLSYLNGRTGETLRQAETTSTGSRLAVSQDGKKLALIPRHRFQNAGENADIIVVAADSFEEIARWSDPDFENGQAIFFTSDAKSLVIGAKERSLLIDMDTGERLVIQGFFALCSHPTARRIYGRRGSAFVEIEIASQKTTKEFKGRIAWINTAEISSDGKCMILACQDGKILVYDARTGTLLKSIQAFENGVNRASLGSRNGLIVAIGRDRRKCAIRCWNLGQVTRAPQRTLLVHSGAVDIAMAWDERSGVLLAGKKDLAAYEVPTPTTPSLIPGSGPALFLSESLLGLRRNDGGRMGLTLVDIPSRRAEEKVLDYSHVVRSRTRETALGARLGHHTDNRIRQMVDLLGMDSPAPASLLVCIDLAAISPDGRYYASGQPQGIHVLQRTDAGSWKVVLGDREPKVQIPEYSESRFARAFFPAAETPLFLVSFLTRETSEEYRVYQLYDLEAKQLVRSKRSPAAASCLEIDSAGKLLVAAVPDGTVRGIDAITLEERFVFRAHDREITALAIRPDGGQIATGNKEGLIRLWQTDAAGKPVKLTRELLSNRGGVESLDFSPSGDQLACVSHSNVVHYDLVSTETPDHVNPGEKTSSSDELPRQSESEDVVTLSKDAIRPTDRPPSEILSSPDWEWSPPRDLSSQVGADSVIAPALSADGTTLVFGSTRPGSLGSGDLYVSTRPSPADRFEWPARLASPVNSEANEGHPCLASDGLLLVFARNNSTGDPPTFWVSERPAIDEPFGVPKKLGVPGMGYAKGPCLGNKGLTLLFQSGRKGGSGDYDLWMSRRLSGKAYFGTPTNLGTDVNSASRDAEATLTNDGLALLFSSDRATKGEPRLMISRRSSTAESFGPPVPFEVPFAEGSTVNWGAISGDGRTLIVGTADGRMLISQRVPREEAATPAE